MDLTQWSAPQMDAAPPGAPPRGITYSQHITCFAVGTHPGAGTTGTTSAILRYKSKAVQTGTEENVGFNEVRHLPISPHISPHTPISPPPEPSLTFHALGDGCPLIRWWSGSRRTRARTPR